MINAGIELYSHIASLFSCMLTHGIATGDLFISTIIPIQARNANLTSADNYSGIALSAILGKLFDLIVLVRYGDILCSSDLQFGFKSKRSTGMCTLILKKLLSIMCTILALFSALCWMQRKRLIVLNTVGCFVC